MRIGIPAVLYQHLDNNVLCQSNCASQSDMHKAEKKGSKSCTTPTPGTTLEAHEPTVARMRKHYEARGLELNAARMRMGTLPVAAEVNFCKGFAFSIRQDHYAAHCSV